MAKIIISSITEIFLIALAFVLAIYQEHIKDVASNLQQTPNEWSEIMQGMINSGSYYTFIILFIMCGIVILLNIWKYKNEKTNTVTKEELNIIFDTKFKPLETAINNLVDEIKKDRESRLGYVKYESPKPVDTELEQPKT